MKKTLLILFLLPFQFIFAQTLPITLTSADMPTAGWSQRVAKDTLPLPAINFGSSGASRTWDFSALDQFSYDTTEYRALTSGQQTTYPNANLAVTTDGVNFLMTRTNGTVSSMQGLQGVLNGTPSNAVFSPVNEIYRFPTQYNGNFSGNWGFVTTVPGSAIGQPLVYQIRVTFTANFTDTIDGWGKTVTPVGAYKSLRQKRVEYSHTVIDIKLTVISQFSNFSDTRDTTVRYNYLSKETKGNILNFDFDSLDNVRSVTYSLIPPAAPIANFSYTNPSGGLTAFTDLTDGYPDSYVWSFGDGTPNSNAQNPNHIYTANGDYEVCLTVTGAGGSTTHCDTVRITGITAGNNAPVAFDDTASTLQPTGVTVNVGNNDIDPDGDTFCVTEVFGSSQFSIAPTGNCTSVLFTPDSMFTGNDTCFYVICDNGNPVLCDTGMFVVSVLPNAALLPIASFTATPDYLFDCQSSNPPLGIYEYTFASTSTNADSVIWTISKGFTAQTITFYGDTLQILLTDLWPNQYPENFEVCITAFNQFGVSTHCDTTCFIYWGSVDETFLSEISVYPNPASQQISVSVLDNDVNGEVDLVIADLQGRKLMQQRFPDADGVITMSVSDLAAGFYTIMLQNTNGQMMGRSKFTISK